jgi:hypothetical protein
MACYGYQISTTYVSTFRGISLGKMNFEGVESKVYGGVTGPFMNMNLFWYRKNPSLSNTSALIIQIGGQVN